jgi:hypothetical protein
MNKKRKPQPQAEEPHMEKSISPEPAEEFVADQSVPSKSMKSQQSKSASSPQRAHDIKPAGHQYDRVECFEPGVEG